MLEIFVYVVYGMFAVGTGIGAAGWANDHRDESDPDEPPLWFWFLFGTLLAPMVHALIHIHRDEDG